MTAPPHAIATWEAIVTECRAAQAAGQPISDAHHRRDHHGRRYAQCETLHREWWLVTAGFGAYLDRCAAARGATRMVLPAHPPTNPPHQSKQDTPHG